jgi:uncharacterized protein YggE
MAPPIDDSAPPDRFGQIAVTGIGRVPVEPDLADLRLGVFTTRPTVEAARAASAATMTAILAALDAADVSRRDVQTALLSVQPLYDYRDGRAPTLTGYQLADVVAVTVRDIARVASVIDGALQAGATSLDGLSFRVADASAPEREARLAAMAAARDRADDLAGAAGLTIVGVGDIVEDGACRPPMPLAKGERMALAADLATPVEAGSLEVVVRVSVTYRTRPTSGA